MVYSVTDDEPGYTELHVVAAYLTKRLLRDGDVRSLVFQDHDRVGLMVVKHAVASFARPVKIQRDFVAHEGGWVTFVLDEEMYEMLPNPFLGREADESAS